MTDGQPQNETEQCCDDPDPLELGEMVGEIYGYTHRCMNCYSELRPED